jgi:glucose-6-phosphate dehydrogenase assembly protein OpcA
LTSRLGIAAEVESSSGPGITLAEIQTKDSDGGVYPITIERPSATTATLNRGDQDSRSLPLPRRGLGDLLAEELRRMDTDPVYAEALSAATGVEIDEQADSRVLVWRDPALADK